MSTYTQTVNRLYPVEPNPFDGFTPLPEQHAVRWDDQHPIFGELVKELKPSVVVEVGSLMGNSAIHIAKCLKGHMLDAVLVCVDTWLAENVLWSMPEHRGMLNIVNGRPRFYDQFMSNIIHAGVADIVCPLSMPSPAGARYLAWAGIKAELIYIDGSHEEWEVYHDLRLYWDLVLEPGGVMVIDDYDPNSPMFTGVVADTKMFARQRDANIEINGHKAILRKGK